MAENFYTILTATGKAKLANSAVLGNKVNFKTLKVGDGKGAYYEPSESQTSLVNEVWSGNISSISIDENNENWITVETIIPATIGGFFIREAGIFDEDGDLIAISKLCETYKPVVSEGSIKDLCIKIILEVSNTENVTLKIDPTIIVATRKDIQTLESKIKDVNTQLSDLEKSIFGPSMVNPSITYGMNNVIRSSSKNSISPKFKIKGKTVINLLGKDGNCEDVSKWSWGSLTTVALDISTKVFGNGSALITSPNTNGEYRVTPNSRAIIINVNKYYCLSAYIKNINYAGIRVRLVDVDKNSALVSSDYTTNTDWTRIFVKVSPEALTGITGGVRVDILGINTAQGQKYNIDGVMLEEITQEQYNDPNFQPSPYVDSYTCLQNPYVEIRHDNLVRNGNGEEGIAWWETIGTGSPTMSIISNKFNITTSGIQSGFKQKVKVKPNTDYYLSGNISGNTQLYANKGSNTLTILRSGAGAFNSGSENEIYVLVHNELTGTGTADSIMLVEGTTPPAEYESCRIERCVLETKLTSDDSITYENGKVSGLIWWKHKILYGKDYDWQFNHDQTGSRALKITNFDKNSVSLSERVIKYDGSIINSINGFVSTTGTASCLNSIGDLWLSILDSDSGWAEGINPNHDEVKAFMNGWKAVWNNGTRYIAWVSIIDGSIPREAIQATISATTNTTSITVFNSGTNFVAGDDILAITQTGIVRSNGTVTGSPTATSISTTASMNVQSGDILIKVDNGTTLLSLLNYCKNNIANGYEGYQLHYKLQNPEPITDDNCHIHGDIPKLDAGDNYLYLDSGIMLGETANFIRWSNNLNYYLNDVALQDNLYQSKLKNKVEVINTIYKNLQYEGDVTITEAHEISYGNQIARILGTDFNVNAFYTVDYKILSTMAPQIGTIECSCERDITSALNNLKEEVNNRQEHDSALDNLVDLSMYETFNLSDWIFPSWIYNGTNLFFQILIPFNMIKKVIPIIGINNLTICYGGQNGLITSKFNLYSIAVQTSKVNFIFSTSDPTTITNIKTYGIEIKLSFTADCRGRV